MSASDLAVLRAIRAMHCRGARPTIATIAARTGYSQAAVSRAIERMEHAGVLLPHGQLRES